MKTLTINITHKELPLSSWDQSRIDLIQGKIKILREYEPATQWEKTLWEQTIQDHQDRINTIIQKYES